MFTKHNIMSNAALRMITNVAMLPDLISISINHVVIIVNCHLFQVKC